MVIPQGTGPTVTVAGFRPQPVCRVPLQVAPLITDTVFPVKFPKLVT